MKSPLMLSDGENLCFNRINGVSARMESETFGPTIKSKIKQLDQTMVTNIIQRVREKLFEDVSTKCLFCLLTFSVLSMFDALSNN